MKREDIKIPKEIPELDFDFRNHIFRDINKHMDIHVVFQDEDGNVLDHTSCVYGLYLYIANYVSAKNYPSLVYTKEFLDSHPMTKRALK